MVSFDAFKKTIELFTENGIRFWIFGGFALDGIRGEVTREHDDIDVYVLSDDLGKLLSLFHADGHSCEKRKNMYFIESDDFKIGVLILTYEDDKIIAHGNNTLVTVPRGIFINDHIVSLKDISFRIAPNEVLVIDSRFSAHDSDKSFGLGLECDRVLFNQIEITTTHD